MNFETFMDTLCIELGLPLTADFEGLIAGVRRPKAKRKLADWTVDEMKRIGSLDSSRTSR